VYAPGAADADASGVLLVCVLQARSAVSAAERDRKQLDKQVQDVSQAIEAATAALQDLQRQIRAAEVGGTANCLAWPRCCSACIPAAAMCGSSFTQQIAVVIAYA
jgi:hypothetical protein